MTKGCFVTGTDTSVGKTWATVALLRFLQETTGERAVAVKPVASGSTLIDGAWVNEDAWLFQQYSSGVHAYSEINPYLFAEPLSPHLAQKKQVVEISVIRSAIRNVSESADWVLIEGAGGWLSPMCQTFDNRDLAESLAWPVILVVGIRLGCINQARLSYENIQGRPVRFAGWVAVVTDPHLDAISGNIDAIERYLGMPPLGVLPYQPQRDMDLLSLGLSHQIIQKLI